MSAELPESLEESTPESSPEIATVLAQLAKPPDRRNSSLWLILGAILFLLTSGQRNLWDLVMVVVVLLVHESGHLIGMKMFGFSDLRMFFIPFFGAAASGRKPGASSTEHAVVLLLGPLPGILIGLALLMTATAAPEPLLLQFGLMFIVINAFNLLPVSPLDGGRLFERLVFNRHFWLEFLFGLTTIAALAGLAYLLDAWFFYLMAAYLVLTFFLRMKRARAGFSLVSRIGHLPRNPMELTSVQISALNASVDESLAGVQSNAKTLATLRTQALQELFDRASTPLASLTASVICLALWACGVVLSFVAVVVWAVARHQGGVA